MHVYDVHFTCTYMYIHVYMDTDYASLASDLLFFSFEFSTIIFLWLGNSTIPIHVGTLYMYMYIDDVF